MRNLTPEHMRCDAFHCPSVHELDDGRLLIVGARAEDVAAVESVAWGEDEWPIIIDRALLANISVPAMTLDKARAKARDIVDEACLGEAFATNGVIAALGEAITDAILDACGEAQGEVKASEATPGPKI